MTPEVAQAWQQQWLRDRMRDMHMAPAIQARVLRLNPVVRTGEIIRGWYRPETIRKSGFYRMAVTRAAFDARWGVGASRRLGPFDRIRAGGRRRWITADAFERGPLA